MIALMWHRTKQQKGAKTDSIYKMLSGRHLLFLLYSTFVKQQVYFLSSKTYGPKFHLIVQIACIAYFAM